jgi:hypothetical protein
MLGSRLLLLAGDIVRMDNEWYLTSRDTYGHFCDVVMVGLVG